MLTVSGRFKLNIRLYSLKCVAFIIGWEFKSLQYIQPIYIRYIPKLKKTYLLAHYQQISVANGL